MQGLIFLTLLALAGAITPTEYIRPINNDCISTDAANSASDASLFPKEFMARGYKVSEQTDNTEVDFAMGFIVRYYSNYKVLTNQIANETYVLYQCGIPPPAADAIPPGAKLFQIPLTSVSTPETVPYAFLEMLGVDDRVNQVSSYVTSACGQKILACGGVAPDLFTVSMDNQTMLAESVTPFVDAIILSGPSAYPKSIAFSSAQDPGLLNRAEWIKFLGFFFNREKLASEIFDEIVVNYNATKDEGARMVANGAKQPVVAWASHYLYDSEEAYELSWADYKEELTQDAGAAMLDFDTIAAIPGVRPSAFSNTTLQFAWTGEGAFASKEEAQAAFLKVLGTADAVLDETFALDPETYDKAAFIKEYSLEDVDAKSLPWLESNLIFRLDGLLSEGKGLDAYEGALVRPDKALEDAVRMVDVIRDPETSPTSPFVWVRRITDTPVVQGPEACERLTECGKEPSSICPFVATCGDGSTVLLTSNAGEDKECKYEACSGTPGAAAATESVQNTAQMAAPAVILLTILIVFVEALINFC